MVNVARLSVTTAPAEHCSEQIAQTFLHQASGGLVFLLAMLFLFLVHLLLQNI